MPKNFKKNPLICPLCQSKKIEKYWGKVWQSPARKVFKCSKCKLLFIWPQLSLRAEKKYYREYIQHLDRRGVANQETPLQTFERRKPLSVYRIDRLAPFLSSQKDLLEIGGGCGNFIYEAIRQQLCRDAVLIESCSDHLEFARRKLKITGFLSIEQLPERKFDIIALFHVLEHIRQPVDFIQTCCSLLKNNGRICIEVPFAKDPLLELYDCSAFKDFYFQPMHHYTYTEESLNFLAQQCNMKAEFIYHQRYPLANHLYWLSYGKLSKDDGFLQMITENSGVGYIQALEKNKTTDTIFCVIKNN